MRRMNGRSPPFVIVGLIFVVLVLLYNYWTLSSQNDDLRKEIDKLQAELKIGGVKQDQFEKKNQILQSSVHDLSEKSERLQRQVEEEDQQLTESQRGIKKKEYEITSLKNDLMKKTEIEKGLMQQLEEKDSKIEELISDSQHILTLKNDAEEALSHKDSQINDLKRELERAKSVGTEYEAQLNTLKNDYSKLKKQIDFQAKENLSKPESLPGAMNIPDHDKAEPYLLRGSLGYVPKKAVQAYDKGIGGLRFHPGAVVLPSQSRDAKRAQPRFSVAALGEHKEENKELSNQIQQPASHDRVQQQMIEDDNHDHHVNNVIPNPPIHAEDVQNHIDPVDHVVEKPNQHPAGANKPLAAPLPPFQGLRRPRVPPLDLHGELQEVDRPPYPEHQNEANVLPQPPQNPVAALQAALDIRKRGRKKENLDAAIDEEEKVIEDPLDDQDEEGKEIKKDLENNADDNYNDDDYDNDDKAHNIAGNPQGRKDSNMDMQNEPRGIGAMDMQNQQPHNNIYDNNGRVYDNNNNNNNNELKNRQPYDNQDNVNFDDEVENKANERVIESNFDNKLRNLGKQL